jgi:phage-related tail protein
MIRVRTQLLFPCFITLAACAHHRDVHPSENGVHEAVIKTEDKSTGFRQAMSQANHYCEQLGKKAYQVNESNEYVGSMDESTYNQGKTIARVAKVAGTVGYVFGGKNAAAIGGTAALGGIAGDAALGEGYEYRLSFTCK